MPVPGVAGVPAFSDPSLARADSGSKPHPTSWLPTLVERANIPYNTAFDAPPQPPGLIEANTVDPFSQSYQYALGWLYFCIVLLVFTFATRLYGRYIDSMRTATYRDTLISHALVASPESQNEPYHLQQDARSDTQLSSLGPLKSIFTLARYLFYRPTPVWTVKKGWRPVALPSLSVICIVAAALIFIILYTFLLQPLYWQSMAFGSPPVAIRSGMLAVSMMPWIILLSMKANLVSIVTGIGHERLNVLHRWLSWLCLLLSLIHMVPFFIQSAQDPDGFIYWRQFVNSPTAYVFATGIASIVPLGFLCLHSLPIVRHAAYELFLVTHVPVAIAFIGLLIWHCQNNITSWNYLWASIAIWVTSYIIRFIFCLNWSNPWRMSSWLIGDEAGVFLLPENAVKVTVPTRMRWKPGQYVYLRMPGVSIFENHPFTITSICSDDFPSEYGEGYRDMVLVFRPFGGFTKRMLTAAVENGPWHTYRAFLDGPYGGMQRSLDAFDHVVLIAGGSGITALTSHLLSLIKRMRDGKAVTKSISVVWAMKRPDVMEWFREELRICREFAPPDSVRCAFYITAAKRLGNQVVSATTPGRPMSGYFHDKVNDAFQTIANKRYSSKSTHSQMIRDEAAGDAEREKELRAEREDEISALPERQVIQMRRLPAEGGHGGEGGEEEEVEHAPPAPSLQHEGRRAERNLTVDVEQALQADADAIQQVETTPADHGFDFGFPNTPTEFQKNLMRFAFLPAATRVRDGWSTEYGRPDLPFMLREMSKEFKQRTCVFVCGPPTMRMDVARTVADLQLAVLKDPHVDELYLHTENYAL